MNDLPNKRQLEDSGDRHGFRLNPKVFIGSLIALVLVIFIFSNSQEQEVRFLFMTFTVPLWLALGVTALLGAAVGALLVVRRQRRARRTP